MSWREAFGRTLAIVLALCWLAVLGAGFVAASAWAGGAAYRWWHG